MLFFPQAAAKPEKRKNPLDSLPRSKTVDLETSKRLFSNNKYADAIKTFDAGGYFCSFPAFLLRHFEAIKPKTLEK